MMKPASRKEFIDFIKSVQKFGRLKYRYIYEKYQVRNNYDKQRIVKLVTGIEDELRQKKSEGRLEGTENSSGSGNEQTGSVSTCPQGT